MTTELYRGDALVGTIDDFGTATSFIDAVPGSVGKVAANNTVTDRDGAVIGSVDAEGIVYGGRNHGVVGEVDERGNVYINRVRCGVVRGEWKHAGAAALLLLIKDAATLRPEAALFQEAALRPPMPDIALPNTSEQGSTDPRTGGVAISEPVPTKNNADNRRLMFFAVGGCVACFIIGGLVFSRPQESSPSVPLASIAVAESPPVPDFAPHDNDGEAANALPTMVAQPETEETRLPGTVTAPSPDPTQTLNEAVAVDAEQTPVLEPSPKFIDEPSPVAEMPSEPQVSEILRNQYEALESAYNHRDVEAFYAYYAPEWRFVNSDGSSESLQKAKKYMNLRFHGSGNSRFLSCLLSQTVVSTEAIDATKMRVILEQTVITELVTKGRTRVELKQEDTWQIRDGQWLCTRSLLLSHRAVPLSANP